MSIYGLPTLNGHRFDEALSALQKMIRRGNEREAMYWAIELEGQFNPHLWNRLEVISHEDIGIADIAVSAAIPVWRAQYKAFYDKKKGSSRLVLANTILAMCRAKKSRLADEFQVVCYRDTSVHAVPDVALDKHTLVGRSAGRGFDHFLAEGAVLANESDIHNPYTGEAEARWRDNGKRKDEI